MKKVFLLLTIFFLSFSNVKSQEYPNSWKMDILCKQGKNEWYESSYVVNVKNNKFQLGPYENKHWKRKNNKWVGEIKGNKISVKETFQATWGSVSIDFKGEFINENEATLKGRVPYDNPWKCKGNFFKVDRPPHFTSLKYLIEATEEIIKFTSYNPGIPLVIINGSYVNSPVEVSGKLILPKKGKNLPVVVTVHSSGGPSEFTSPTQSWRNDFKNQLLKNNIGIFEIDNFTSRGTENVHKNQGKVSVNAGEFDALIAYNVLDKHPRVDATKLGITGLSRGGTASYMVAEKKFSEAVIGKDKYFLASLPMAPDCFNMRFENPAPTKTKLLFLLGGADDYTPARFCVSYAERLKKAGADVEVIVKEGWHHDFYTDTPANKCKQCVHFNKCELYAPDGWKIDDQGFISESLNEVMKKEFKMDIKKWRKDFEKASAKSGKANKLYRKMYMKLYKKCGSRGTTVGGDNGGETADLASKYFIDNLK